MIFNEALDDIAWYTMPIIIIIKEVAISAHRCPGPHWKAGSHQGIKKGNTFSTLFHRTKKEDDQRNVCVSNCHLSAQIPHLWSMWGVWCWRSYFEISSGCTDQINFLGSLFTGPLEASKKRVESVSPIRSSSQPKMPQKILDSILLPPLLSSFSLPWCDWGIVINHNRGILTTWAAPPARTAKFFVHQSKLVGVFMGSSAAYEHACTQENQRQQRSSTVPF